MQAPAEDTELQEDHKILQTLIAIAIVVVVHYFTIFSPSMLFLLAVTLPGKLAKGVPGSLPGSLPCHQAFCRLASAFQENVHPAI